VSEFSVRSQLEVQVDSRSLSDARDTIESELGSVRATVEPGRGAGTSAPDSVAALADGGSGVRDLLETQTEHLSEIQEAVEDIRNGGPGGSGIGGAAVGTGLAGLASTATTATAIGLAGLAPIASFVGAISANAENGPRTDPGAPAPRPDTGESARDTGRMDSEPLFRPNIQAPDWLSRLTNASLSAPDWLSRLTSLSFETPEWVGRLTSLSFDAPPWIDSLTNPQIQAPSWLSTLVDPQITAPSWIRSLQRVLDGPDTSAAPTATDSGLAPSDQGLVNAATRRRREGGGRTEVRNDITIEAIIDDLGSAQRIIEQAVDEQLRRQVLD
jgi:hypothetical protein